MESAADRRYYIPIFNMVVDGFTKPLNYKKFVDFVALVRLL